VDLEGQTAILVHLLKPYNKKQGRRKRALDAIIKIIHVPFPNLSKRSKRL